MSLHWTNSPRGPPANTATCQQHYTPRGALNTPTHQHYTLQGSPANTSTHQQHYTPRGSLNTPTHQPFTPRGPPANTSHYTPRWPPANTSTRQHNPGDFLLTDQHINIKHPEDLLPVHQHINTKHPEDRSTCQHFNTTHNTSHYTPRGPPANIPTLHNQMTSCQHIKLYTLRKCQHTNTSHYTPRRLVNTPTHRHSTHRGPPTNTSTLHVQMTACHHTNTTHYTPRGLPANTPLHHNTHPEDLSTHQYINSTYKGLPANTPTCHSTHP